MAVWDPGDRGATRGGTAVDRYVRELLRDAERMRRSSRRRRPRGRSDAVDAADRSSGSYDTVSGGDSVEDPHPDRN